MIKCLGIAVLFLVPTLCRAETHEIRQNEVLEITLESTRSYDNPYVEIELDLHLTDANGRQRVVPAYWGGGQQWKVRLSAPDRGTFTYRTICTDHDNNGLHNRTGTVIVEPYAGSNLLLKHGPVTVDATKHLVHADGTPFLWLADSWWHGMTTRFKWPKDFEILTRDRKEKGFSVIQFAIGFPCDIVEFDQRGANEAGFPTSQDYRRINPSYFDLVDLRVQHLVDNGLVPNVLGTWRSPRQGISPQASSAETA